MFVNKLNFWKTFKRIIHILIGFTIGFFVTRQFRSLNYESFKKDILFQLCSYRSLNYIHGNDQIFHVSTKTDLARTFNSIRNLSSINHSNRKLLLVGVMTTKSFIKTRASAIYETWGQDLFSDIIFFTSSDLKTSLPYVALPHVDDTYPPQKKSFFMLKFMFEFFGDRYKFFMRADDDVFVNVNKLKNFLESLNSSEPIYIGQTGVGNREEFGRLNLDSHENFCMGGPGVIMSSQALSKIAKNVGECLQNLYSTHEDVEVGRCLKKHSGVSCTWSYDMQNLFYHNTSIQNLILNENFSSKDLLNALTIHPIKNPKAMKNLYIYFKNTHYQTLNFRITKLLRALKNILPSEIDSHFLSELKTFSGIEKIIQEIKLYGFDPSFKFLFKNSSIWNFFSRKIFTELSLNPKKNIEKDLIQSFNQNIQHILSSLNSNSFKKGSFFDYHSLYYGYNKFDLSFGSQYIYNILLMYRKYQGKRLTLPVRKHIYAIQTFSPSRIIEMKPDETIDPDVINIIMPLAGRITTFKRFIDNFVDVLKRDNHVTLTIVLFPNNQTDMFNQVETILNQTNVMKKSILELDGKFSRGTALQKSLDLFSEDSLLFFLDVDMLFNVQVLNRVRRNTILGRQIYFPIVFSQYGNYSKKWTYSPSIQTTFHNSPLILGEQGYWRQFGYGIVSLYKQDLLSVGGYDTKINGWGMEDVNLYDRFIASNNLTIFRTIDPDLIHVYHDIICDKNLSTAQFEMCLGTKFFSLDSVQAISKMIRSQHFLSN